MKPLLEVRHLKKYYTNKTGFFTIQKELIKAVEDVSLHVNACETLGIVGESGCGKTTTGRAILRLIEPTEGEVIFDGVDVRALDEDALRKFRARMQIVFQDALYALDPRWTIKQSLEEPIKLHFPQLSAAEVEDRVDYLLGTVGFASMYKYKYPHEFSGGQRQRICIAKAISLNPQFIVCDEPVSALDVSIQAQVLALMNELQENLKLSYMFISHDLSVVKYISNRVGVMYAGQLVELGETKEFFSNPLHPYSQLLKEVVPYPYPDPSKKRVTFDQSFFNRKAIAGGCPFESRCTKKCARCATEKPEYREVSTGHFVACHLYT